MKITGSGSRLSPIAIDDSEDEVLQELVGEAGFEPSPFSPMADQHDKGSRSGVLTNTSKEASQKTSFEGKPSRKRKRSMNDMQSGSAASTSQQRLDTSMYLQPVALSKKAKKRRRKLERLLEEHGGQPPRPPMWLNGTHHLTNELSNSRIMGGVGVRLDKPQAASGPYSTSNAADSTSYNSETPVASSSSPWVASMAMAAEAPMSMLDGRGTESWDSYAYSVNWSDHSKPPAVSIPQFSEPIPAPKPPPAPPPATMAASAAPAGPPPTQVIGMKPDHDPSSKHGLFVIPPNASRGNTDFLSAKGNPYIPNPARTLVMEQLPKSHRTQDWVKNWSKSACGAYPVFSCIDHHGAKALVEFATAELARKAWGSPRLGAALSGLKTHQLKGRPREDLIKVWWYRVDGIGANAGVGEIEEGEIEGDAAEKETEVPVKKETKKERKARLLRERQAKKAAAAEKLPLQLQQSSPVNGDAHEGSVPKEVATPQSLALSPNSAQYSQGSKSGYSYHSITPQPLPRPLPHTPVPAPLALLPRAPLPPQSSLETQWRPKHELPKKPTRETILNATASIISSIKSSTPIQTSPTITQPVPPLLSLPVTPTYEDMDVGDDMDLESPRTAERIIFDLTPAGSSQRQPDASQSVSLATQMARVAVPNTLASSTTSKTDAPSTTSASVHHTLSDPESIANQFATSSLETITSQPPSTSGTPPLEPRAMKNIPKGPSFKIRLLARQKELEEKISKSRLELGIITAPVPPTVSIASPMPTRESSLQEDEEDKQAMEKRLRSLVLRSQKNRSRSSVSATRATNTQVTNTQVSSPIPTADSPISGSVITPAASALHEAPASVSAIPSAKTSTFSLDDLAVSFITETLETCKATPNPSMPTPSAAAAPAPGPITAVQSQNTKLTAMAKQRLELAAQQKRLEAHIAETKVLMMKFQKARTKQEREAIMTAMREQSWTGSISNDDDPPTTTTTTIASALTRTMTAQVTPDPTGQLAANNAGNNMPGHTTVYAVKKWPGSHEHDAGVLIVSDDEDEESECDH